MQVSLAPMAGYTDLPLRRMCRRFGLEYGTTALIDAGALVHGNHGNAEILHRGEEEGWLQVQLLGSVPTDLRFAVKALRDGPWHFDNLDFNMGCPVRKVLKRRAGAGLMKEPVQAVECLKVLRDLWPGSLTVKMRILKEDEDPAPTVALAQRLEAVGIDGLTIHGRLARMLYSGPVQCGVIRAVREALKIPVTANGGVFTRADALALAEATGCDRVMVARGALGNPWLFRALATCDETPPSREELLDVMREHLAEMVREYGEKQALILGRKVISGYLSGRGFPHELRAEVVHLCTWDEFTAFQRQLAVCRWQPPG